MQLRLCTPIFLCFTLAVFIYVLSLPRIPQDPTYHMFADRRSMLGMPNFLDVMSNMPFLVAGIWGLICTVPQRQRPAFREKHERWPYVLFSLGVTLTCFGSAYYHWSPDNSTLVWDRLPMAVSFMGIFAGTISDRIGARAGRLFLAPLLVIGLLSVLYWYFSELKGAGDLRLYFVVQFFTIAAIFLLIILFPARYTHSGWLIAAGGAYVLAKVLEVLDKQVFYAVKISGHTLKHLIASLAAFCIVGMIMRRSTAEAQSKDA
ncbi:MAG TPA: alkaline phytoceramidase [Acidobacteriota bacterium]|nr:alkaline phytoceramidase [Acidobacteriota bacterium]